MIHLMVAEDPIGSDNCDISTTSQYGIEFWLLADLMQHLFTSQEEPICGLELDNTIKGSYIKLNYYTWTLSDDLRILYCRIVAAVVSSSSRIHIVRNIPDRA